jgi:hypothetical protein
MTTQLYTSRFTLVELLDAFQTISRGDGSQQTHLCPTIVKMIAADHGIDRNYCAMSLQTNIFQVLHGLSPEDFNVRENGEVGAKYSVMECELKDYTNFLGDDTMMEFRDELRIMRTNYLSHLIAKVGNVQLEFTAKVEE